MRNIYFLICFIIGPYAAFAQIVTTPNSNAQQLAQSLVGPGITISNATLNCPSGFAGSFTGTSTNLGIGSGVILASGDIANAEGPNVQTGITTAGNAPGDAQLTSIAGQSTNDACVLEFDLFTIADTIKFNYVFGSDEYPEYVNSINDVFAFFISGPGIVGSQNIALIPGTVTPVSINNVNDGHSFSCVNPGPGCTNCAYYVNNCSGSTVEYDGFTTVLTAVAVVQPCQTYHLKLAIADASDDVLDSGVFIEAGSLISTGVQLSTSTSAGSFPYAIEGCNDGVFTFDRINPDTTNLVVKFQIGGSATNGVDYTQIPDSIVIPAGATKDSILIEPFADGLPEGVENVILYIVDNCQGNVIDSAVIEISDKLIPELSSDTVICQGDSAKLVAGGAFEYTWIPSTGLSSDTVPDPFAQPLTTTQYVVKFEVANCVNYDTLNLYVNPAPPITVTNDMVICEGDTAHLSATGGATYKWSPTIALNNPNIANPFSVPGGTFVYTVTIADSAGCKNKDSVRVQVNPVPVATADGDTAVCAGQPVALSASGSYFYSWSPTTGISDPASPTPVATPSADIVYTVTVSDSAGCSAIDSVFVEAWPLPVVSAGPDQIIQIGESATLDGSSSVVTFSWSPATGLNDPYSLSPLANPEDTTVYTISATDDLGCSASDEVIVIVEFTPTLAVPNAFTPNGDGLNDYFNVLMKGLVVVKYFKVYNRWGEVIYQDSSQDIVATSSNHSYGWDGTFKGSDQPSGVYTYIFEGEDLEGNPVILQGNVTLIR